MGSTQPLGRFTKPPAPSLTTSECGLAWACLLQCSCQLLTRNSAGAVHSTCSCQVKSGPVRFIATFLSSILLSTQPFHLLLLSFLFFLPVSRPDLFCPTWSYTITITHTDRPVHTDAAPSPRGRIPMINQSRQHECKQPHQIAQSSKTNA